MAGTLQHLGRFDDSNNVARQCIAFGEAAQDIAAQAMGYEFLGENTINKGDWEKALGYAEKERELARKINSRDRYAWTCLVVCVSHNGLAQYKEAEAAAREGVELARELGESRLETLMRCFLSPIVAGSGRLDEALDLARDAIERAEASEMFYLAGEANRNAMEVYLRREDYPQALAHAEKTLKAVADAESVVSRLWLGPDHVRCLLALDRTDEAREVFMDWLPIVEQCQAPRFTAEAERLRGLLGL